MGLAAQPLEDKSEKLNPSIIFHAIWEPFSSKFHLWAESSSFFQATSKGKKAVVERHPSILAPASLFEYAKRISDPAILEQAVPDKMRLLLSSNSKAPLPSTSSLSQDLKSTESLRLIPWEIVTLALRPLNALNFLASLSVSPPLVLGEDLIFWKKTAVFCLELIAGSRFVPVFQEVASVPEPQASWRIKLFKEDQEKIDLLRQALPPVLCAFVPPDGHLKPAPHKVIQSFLNQTISAFVFKDVAVSQELKTVCEKIDFYFEEKAAWRIPQPLLCFKLVPPLENRGAWSLEFYLRSREDSGFLLPASKVWKTSEKDREFFREEYGNPQEQFLHDLTRAVELFPAVEESLKTAVPASLALSAGQAYSFLKDFAPRLDQNGFSVFFPSWWQRRIRPGVKLHLRPVLEGRAENGFGLRRLVEYDWQVALGDEAVSMEEFEKIVEQKLPLLSWRGKWVELTSEELKKATQFFENKNFGKTLSLGNIFRLILEGENTEIGLPVAAYEVQGWLKVFLGEAGDFPGLQKEPRGFQGKLRPYQMRGIAWLSFLSSLGLGACLADDMGLGKTIQLIGLLLLEREQTSKKIAPTLLVCPMSIVGNWQREIEKFAPSIKVLVHHGEGRLTDRKFAEEVLKNDLVITTYTLVFRDKELLSRISWDHIVLDEAQNIKNETAKQTQAVKQFEARQKIALTGTPVENKLSELWSIMDFLNPAHFGSSQSFREKFAIPVERDKDAKQLAKLQRLIRPFILRRLKTDKKIIRDLPEKMEMKVFCNLTREQASLYEAAVREMLAKIENSEGIQRKGLVLATIVKLKQICNHPALFLRDKSEFDGRSGKLNRLGEMLEEVIAEKDKALVFTQFQEMGAMLETYLKRFLACEVLYLHGGTPAEARNQLIGQFQNPSGGPGVFILSLKAGGTGLNLTEASHVFHFDRWWNPAVENQATDRAYRIGQKKRVQVHKFIALGTLEERIDQILERKRFLADQIVGTGEDWITEMSAGELRELFELKKEAASE